MKGLKMAILNKILLRSASNINEKKTDPLQFCNLSKFLSPGLSKFFMAKQMTPSSFVSRTQTSATNRWTGKWTFNWMIFSRRGDKVMQYSNICSIQYMFYMVPLDAPFYLNVIYQNKLCLWHGLMRSRHEKTSGKQCEHVFVLSFEYHFHHHTHHFHRHHHHHHHHQNQTSPSLMCLLLLSIPFRKPCWQPKPPGSYELTNHLPGLDIGGGA